MKSCKYTQQQLVDAVKTSTSYRQVLTKLGLKEAGGNYRTLKTAIEHFNLDVSHMTGKGHNKGKKRGPKRDIQVYLKNEAKIQSNKLRKLLLNEHIFQHQCSMCQKSEWLGNPIPLELDHIDGDHLNNDLKNLRLLCPNCHATTPTYRGRNKKRNSH